MSYSRLLNPAATCSIARMAESASGARPRFVCSTTPVALMTRRRDGRVASRTAEVTDSTHCCSLRFVPPVFRAASTVVRTASSTTRRGCWSRSDFTPAVSSSAFTLGMSRLESFITRPEGGSQLELLATWLELAAARGECTFARCHRCARASREYQLRAPGTGLLE